MRSTFMRAARSRWAPIVALVLVNLTLGAVLTPHYGQSTDEWANLIYARATLESYEHPERPFVDPSREDKGPFYLMLWLRTGEALDRVIPGWAFVDSRHFVNFLAFQMAVICVYVLALRFVKPAAALAAALLFESQPVLFGHAFINQKDTPFMAFFAAALTLGLAMADDLGRRPGTGEQITRADADESKSRWERLRSAWPASPTGDWRHPAFVVLVFLAPAVWFWINRILRTAVAAVVVAAYRGEAWPSVNSAFERLAENAAVVPVEAYVRRAMLVVDGLFLLGWLPVMAVVLGILTRMWPESGRRIRTQLSAAMRAVYATPLPRLILPAAIVLGMAIAIRSTALLAGFLVVGYMVCRFGNRSLGVSFGYLGLAGFTAYALWPQLWQSPAALAVSSLERTLQFPQQQRTLFEGVAYLSSQLPRWYLPELIAIQFTLPAVALILAGLVTSARRLKGAGATGPTLVVLFTWFAVPFVAVVVFGVPIYNYFRHVLFIMPPLFVLAAIPLQDLLSMVRSSFLRVVFAFAMLLPGVSSIVRLHPYEYGYFNELVGGVRGAYGRFVSDYWCTSLREAMAFVNAYAPSSAVVSVTEPRSNALLFAREDLTIVNEPPEPGQAQPQLVVGCTWSTIDPAFHPDAPVIWTVEREGVPLAVIKLVAMTEP